jgi:hypothetical protein
MQKKYGAAEPIIDWAHQFVDDFSNKTNKLLNSLPSYKRSKKDDSWHDKMVHKANESFRKPVQKKKVVKTTTQGTTIRKNPTTAKKSTQKKRVAGK